MEESLLDNEQQPATAEIAEGGEGGNQTITPPQPLPVQPTTTNERTTKEIKAVIEEDSDGEGGEHEMILPAGPNEEGEQVSISVADYRDRRKARKVAKMSKIRKVFDCGVWTVFTWVLLIVTVTLFAVAHPHAGLLFFCAIIPGLLLMTILNATHLLTSTWTELQWEVFWSGAVSILIALVGEIALNGAITSLLKVAAPSQYKSILQKNHGHMAVVTVMSAPLKLLYFFLNAFFIAGLVEEAMKVGVVYRIQKKLYTPIACVIYGVCGAVGFATVENIKYVIVAGMKAQFNPIIINSNMHSYFADLLKHNPYLYGVVVAFERGFTSIPGHCLFGALVGLGFARRLINSDVRRPGIDETGIRSVPLWQVLFPSLFFHGLYDFSLMCAGMLSSGWVRSMLISFAHAIVGIVFLVVIVWFAFVQHKFKKLDSNTASTQQMLDEDELYEL